MGKMEDIMVECSEWGLDIVCLTETQMRERLEINGVECGYKVLSKGRSKQLKKGGGVAIMVKQDSDVICEVLNIGECSMSEDIIAVKLEYGDESGGQNGNVYICLCYMTVEGHGAADENRRKYDVVQQFVNKYKDEQVIVLGDMNGHIGLLGEEENGNGKMLREVSERMNLEILNETIARGRVTWQARGQKSAIDYVLANEQARERVMDVWIDEEGEIGIDSDHNMIVINYICKRVKRAVQPTRKPKWRLKCADWKMFSDKIYKIENLTSSEAESMNDEIIRNVKGVAMQSIGHTKGGKSKRKCKSWWSEEIRDARNERKVLSRQCRKLRKRNADEANEEYLNVWEAYKLQKKKVKNMIKDARIKDENKKVKELREQGEKGGREWFRFLRGDQSEKS